MALLTDRTVVVTGAGRGIGREIALALAGEGARVALAARSRDALEAVAAEIRGRGGDALVVATDLRDGEAIDRLGAAVGPVDALVCNAGAAGPTAPLWEVEPEQWDETLAVNLTGVYRCCRAFLPGMVARGAGSVVVIGSATGKQPLYGRTPYAASKLGLVGLVRTLALDAGRHGVRVNLVSPGAVTGERIDGVIRAQAEAKGTSEEAVRAQLAAAAALGRFVEPAQIADAVVFLTSDRALGVTGADLNVTAGYVMH